MTREKGAEKGAVDLERPFEDRRAFEDFERGAAAAVVERPSGGFVLRDDMRPLVEERVEWADPRYAGMWLIGLGDHRVRQPILKHPRQLLRDFETAAADPTGDAILNLANKYGWLGERFAVLPLARRATLPGANLVDDYEIGEQVSTWREQLLWLHDVFEVRHAIRLLEAEAGTPSETREARNLLRDRIRRTSGGALKYISGPQDASAPYSRQRFLAVPGAPEADNVEAYVADDLHVRAARYYLSLELNDRIRDGQIYPQLMPLRNNVIRFFPRTVLAAVYLALLLELAGGMPERACAKCGSLFTATRSDREFCSRGCKEAARKVRARARASAARAPRSPAVQSSTPDRRGRTTA